MNTARIPPRQSFIYETPEPAFVGGDFVYSFSCADGALEFSVSILNTGPSNPLKSAHGAIAITHASTRITLTFTNPSFFQTLTCKFTVHIFQPLGLALFPSTQRPVGLIVTDPALAALLQAKYNIVAPPPEWTRASVFASGRRFLAFGTMEQARGLVSRALCIASEAQLLEAVPDVSSHIVASPRHGEQNVPSLVLGSMTFGPAHTAKVCRQVLEEFALLGDEVDSARVYGSKLGETETLLGTVCSAQGFPALRISSKANPLPPLSLSASSIAAQFAATCKALKRQRLHIYYLHAPDVNTPVLESLVALDRIHRQGGFAELGLSNFAAWQVADIYHLCTSRGLVRPTVYQGMYNAVTRDVEKELLPCLRALGIRFYCYNPLAGGLLSDRYSDPNVLPSHGRFAEGSKGKQYRDRYWTAAHFEALGLLRAACDECRISVQAAALRWLAHHSMLQQTDAIIIGCSTLQMFKDNSRAVREGGCLPVKVLMACESAWRACIEYAPTYWRPYSVASQRRDLN